MEFTPFSHAEAAEICDDFQDLTDTEFSLSGELYIVESVTVCPFSQPARDTFLDAFIPGSNTTVADNLEDGYDVVLIVSLADAPDNVSFMAIRHFVAEKGIRYNFPTV